LVSKIIIQIIDEVAETIFSNTELLGELDRAIGDGDHGINMKRGFTAMVNHRDKLAEMSLPKAIQKTGEVLLMNIGGASGPLYGTFCISIGKSLEDKPFTFETIKQVMSEGILAVKKRGKSDIGQKTMLDVLYPVVESLSLHANHETDIARIISQVRTAIDEGLESTINMLAKKGRASFLGTRSVGHIDPGAKSSQLIIHSICDVIESRIGDLEISALETNDRVGIVIVSHSKDVASGTLDMVRQMAGNEIPVACCGGIPKDNIGVEITSIKAVIEEVWSPAGVVVLVDIGGTEINCEMAIEMLPEDLQQRIMVCDAPVVEGAVMAAVEAAGGGSLVQVKAAAEGIGKS